MEINIRMLTGKNRTFQVSQNATIAKIKTMIADKEGLIADQIILVHPKLGFLCNSATLTQLEIENGATIFSLVPLRNDECFSLLSVVNVELYPPWILHESLIDCCVKHISISTQWTIYLTQILWDYIAFNFDVDDSVRMYKVNHNSNEINSNNYIYNVLCKGSFCRRRYMEHRMTTAQLNDTESYGILGCSEIAIKTALKVIEIEKLGVEFNELKNSILYDKFGLNWMDINNFYYFDAINQCKFCHKYSYYKSEIDQSKILHNFMCSSNSDALEKKIKMKTVDNYNNGIYSFGLYYGLFIRLGFEKGGTSQNNNGQRQWVDYEYDLMNDELLNNNTIEKYITIREVTTNIKVKFELIDKVEGVTTASYDSKVKYKHQFLSLKIDPVFLNSTKELQQLFEESISIKHDSNSKADQSAKESVNDEKSMDNDSFDKYDAGIDSLKYIKVNVFIKEMDLPIRAWSRDVGKGVDSKKKMKNPKIKIVGQPVLQHFVYKR